MAGEPQITITGNLTGDPDFKFTNSGAPVVNFSVAVTPRNKVPNSDQWEDGETTFYRCAAWRRLAENVAASLQKGHRVIVVGRLKTRTWQNRDNVDQLSLEIDVDEVGPSLQFGETQYRKTGQGQQGGHQQPQQQRRQGPPAGGDPWAQQPAQQPAQGDPWQQPQPLAPNPWQQPQYGPPQQPAGPPPQQRQQPTPDQAWGQPPQRQQPAQQQVWPDEPPF